MYLSTLLINVGDNPDRPRPGRLWLRNLYRVHQRLCMGFPSPRLTDGDSADYDPAFLKPYDPDNFPEDRYMSEKTPDEVGSATLHQVHAKRDNQSGFLFRVEPQPGGKAVILVLSAIEPNWDYAFGLKQGLLDDRGRPVGNAGHLLAGPPDKPRPLQLPIEPGKRFRFRLLANPTKRPPLTKAQRLEKKQAGEKVKRPRMQITWKEGADPAEAFAGWLCDRAEKAGFWVDREQLAVSSIGYVYIRKGGPDAPAQRLRSARFEGVLEVTDADAFAKTLSAGIGPAKAFGFGLLSVAPIGS